MPIRATKSRSENRSIRGFLFRRLVVRVFSIGGPPPIEPLPVWRTNERRDDETGKDEWSGRFGPSLTHAGLRDPDRAMTVAGDDHVIDHRDPEKLAGFRQSF